VEASLHQSRGRYATPPPTAARKKRQPAVESSDTTVTRSGHHVALLERDRECWMSSAKAVIGFAAAP
jgi:hypothetical protein